MKKTFATAVRVLLLLAMLAAGLGLSSKTAFAATEIPYDATIISAQLKLIHSDGTVPSININVHRVLVPWQESTVTWNTFNSVSPAYDPTISSTFNSGVLGEVVSVDVTSLVRGWVNGDYENNGLLLKSAVSSPNGYVVFNSSEGGTPPVLEICYEQPGAATPTCITVQSQADPDFQDTYIWQNNPDVPNGESRELYVGELNGYLKYTLLQFKLLVGQHPANPGTGTPGFWKNHPEAWPVDSITIGSTTYTKDQAIDILKMNDKQDKTITMFRDLVAAKLNVAIGNDASCISGVITQADAWMAAHPAKSGVPASSTAWQGGEPLATALDNYNNGLMCAPHRD